MREPVVEYADFRSKVDAGALESFCDVVSCKLALRAAPESNPDTQSNQNEQDNDDNFCDSQTGFDLREDIYREAVDQGQCHHGAYRECDISDRTGDAGDRLQCC